MLLEYGIYPVFFAIALIAIASVRIWIRQHSGWSLLMMVGALIHVTGVMVMVMAPIAGHVASVRSGAPLTGHMNWLNWVGIANGILVPVGLVLFSVGFVALAFKKTEKS